MKKKIGTWDLGLGTWEFCSEILNFNAERKVRRHIPARHLLPIICLSFIIFAACETPTSGGGGGDNGGTDKTVTAFDLYDYIAPPVKDTTPNTAPIDADEYTGTVSWLNEDGTTLEGDFKAYSVYKARAELSAKEGWTFAGVGGNFFEYSGARNVTNGADSGIVTVTFYCTDQDPITPIDPSKDAVTIDGTVEVDNEPTANVGDELTANLDNANHEGDVSDVSYQWQKSSKSDGVFKSIAGETGETYTPVMGDWGQYIRVQVTAIGNAGKTSSGPVLITGKMTYTLAEYLDALDTNTARTPYTIPLGIFKDFYGKTSLWDDYDETKEDTVWSKANSTIGSSDNTKKYVILDLRAYVDTTITGNSGTPGNTDFNVIKNNKFIVGLILPETLETIGEYALSGCYNLPSGVVMPESLTAIEARAFDGCGGGSGGLTNVTIPDKVTTIGEHAFNNCLNLTSIKLGSHLETLGANAFYANNFTEIQIPVQFLTSVAANAFDQCTYFATITCNYNDPTRYNYFAQSGVLYNVDTKATAAGPGDYSVAIIPQKLTGDIIIPEGVTTLPNGGTSVTLNQFNSLITITSVSIPGTVETIPKQCFFGCSNITKITLNEGITTIGQQAFFNNKVTSVTIPSSVTSIGANAFYGTAGTTGSASITINGATGEDTTNIAANAFNSWGTKIGSVTFGSGNISIANDNAFPDGAKLRVVANPEAISAPYTPNPGTYQHSSGSWSKQ